jgi:hypothetical protein
MMGVSPLAIPLTHEYTKYPSVEERTGNLVSMHEEALAAHAFARSHMLQRVKSNFQLFVVGQKVWLEAKNLKTIYNKKDRTKTRRTILNHEHLITTQLFTPTSSDMVHS